MKPTIKLILLLIALIATDDLIGRHIIGSDFYYNCRGQGRNASSKIYDLHLDVYRDCSTNIPFNNNAAFGVYTYSPGRGYRFYQQFNIGYGVISRVNADQNPCIIIPPNVCVETTYFEFTVELPVSDETYIIYYIQCCRNRTILNIPNPGTTGSTFFIEIFPEAQQTCNISPRFKTFPPIVICGNFPLEYDHSAKDAEGDSLVYEFCQSYAGGGMQNGGFGGIAGCSSPNPEPRVCPPPFNTLGATPGYSFLDPLGKDVLKLDKITGLLTGSPKELGQYVVGVCVKEYRNGIQIGALHRDFQFNVAICEQAVTAKIKADSVSLDGKSFSLNYCGDNLVGFTNQSFTESFIKDYYWEFRPKSGNGPVLSSNEKNAKINFPTPGQYKGVMIVNRNAIVCNDTAYINLNIIPSDLKSDFTFEYDKCNASPIKFNNLSSGNSTPVRTINWEFGDGSGETVRNPVHLYKKPGDYDIKLTVTDGKICRSSTTKKLPYFPSPALLDILPDKFRACVPATIYFNNLSIPVDSTYEVNWEFGDGNTAKTIHASHEYKKAGTYSIKLSLKAPNGCTTVETFPNFVRIQEGPDADFTYNPKEPTTKDPTVKFTDISKDAISYLWDFGDESGSTDRNPTHFYKDTGDFAVLLTVKSANGCTDTIRQNLRVGLNISYFLPNAFTPNNDGINDLYYGVGSFVGMRDFQLRIFNRWGELIFHSLDPNEGWNGRKNNKGSIEPNGVYVCVVNYKDDHGDLKELKGFATLIR